MHELSESLGHTNIQGLHTRLSALLDECRVCDFLKDMNDLILADLPATAPEMLNPTRASNNMRKATIEDARLIVEKSLFDSSSIS